MPLKARFSRRFEEYPPPLGKEGEMRTGCGGGVDPKECPYFHRLQFDLANSYYWSGGCCQDYVYFVQQWHPFLGMFCCHPNHPWTKFERFLMFLVSLAITMVPSAYLSSWPYSTYWTVWFITIPDCIIGIVLYQIAIAETRGCCHVCAPCLRICTYYAIITTLAIGGTCTSFCAWLMSLRSEGEIDWSAVLRPLIVGKIISYITWFPIWTFLPCQLGFFSLWCYEKAKALEPCSDPEAAAASSGSDQESSSSEGGKPGCCCFR